MTSIPVTICRLSDSKFKRLYLNKKRHFVDFFCISEIFFAFPSPWNLEHSEKKDEYPSLIITEIIVSERDIYLSV